MLRVLYKVGLPAEKGNLLEGASKRPKAESGAQRAPAKPSGAERLRAAKKLRVDQATAKREADAQAEALRDQIWADEHMKRVEKMTGYKSDSSRDEVAEALADVQGIEKQRVADLNAEEDAWAENHMKNVEAFTGYKRDAKRDEVAEALADVQNIEKQRVEEDAWAEDHMKRVEAFTGYKRDANRDEVAEALADVQNIEKQRVDAEESAWADEHMKRVEAFTGYKRDANRDEVAEALAEVQQIEADRVRGERAPLSLDEKARLGHVFMQEDFDQLARENGRNLSVDEKVRLDKALTVGEVQGLKDKLALQQERSLLPELPVNAPQAQIEAARRALVDQLAGQAKVSLRKEYLLKQGLANAESDAERTRVNAAIVEAQRAADASLALEFYAEHDSPRATQQHYNQARQERVALLNDKEATRVLKALNEMRGGLSWEDGEYITSDMINELPAMDHDLARRWHALEKSAGELAAGIARLREHHETRVQLTEMKVNAVIEGNWASDEVRKVLRTPGINMENAVDQIFTDPRRFDVPQTGGEKAVAAVMNFKLFGGFPGRALMEAFGRKFANKSLNEAMKGIDPVQKSMNRLDGEKNAGKGVVLGRGTPDFGGVSNVTNFSSAARAAEMGGNGYTSGSRREGGDVAITQEAANDLQLVLSGARYFLDKVRNGGSVTSADQESITNLNAKLYDYKNTPTARSRAYDAALTEMEEALGVLRRSKVEKVSWTPLEADLGVDWSEGENKVDEQEVIDDMTAEATMIEEVEEKLEAGVNRLSNAQLEKIDRATETLESGNKGLAEALAKGEPLGRLFIKSLEQFTQDRETTLRLLTLNRLNDNPAAQDLEAALGKTRNLLQEYRSLEARPLAYRAVVQGLETARNLEGQLNAPSALMSPERRANLEGATTDVSQVAKEMQSANIRAGKLSPEAIATNGDRYRKAIQNARGLLRKTPASMRSSTQAQALQTSLAKAENNYQLWARKNGQRQLTNVEL